MILVCKQCRKGFSTRRSRNTFCGHACHSASMRKADLGLLDTMAARGDMGKNMATDLGISRGRLHHILRTRGLMKLWRQHRYHKAGSTSAIGASDPQTAIGPSSSTV